MIKCKICGKEFKNRTAMTNHLRFKHNLTGKEYYDKYLAIKDHGKCKICGKPTRFLNIVDGYNEGCCMDHTNIARYGNNYGKRSEETKKKISQTVSSKECQEKTKKTNLERYGRERFVNPEKAKQTCLKKYGVDNPWKVEDIQNKCKETKLKKYGDENYNNREKYKVTCQEKYGGNAPIYSDKVKEKMKQTCLEKYGVTSTLASKEIQEKITNTNFNKYGMRCPANYNNQEKSKLTKLKKYGNKNYHNIEKAIETFNIKINEFEQENNCTLQSTLVQKYGQGWLSIQNKCSTLNYNGCVFVLNSEIPKIEEYNEYHKYCGKSHLEKQIVEYIKSIYNGNIIENTRKIISPYELDIYIPDKKLSIEFNGSYWHSWPNNNNKNYHLKKSQACEELDIRLIHIYEWELQEPYWSKIKMMLNQALNNNSTIYARNCIIKEITNKEAKKLNEQVHLQGHRNAQVTYGLFYKDQLVQLMSFSKTRYNRNLKGDNDWEIIRGCPGSNVSVIGGVSKLFKHFIREYNPDKVFSYCDFNKFDGISYEKLGMNFVGYTGPDKTWIINGQPVKRNPKKYKELKAKAKAIMWGAGSKKYEWIKEDYT